jgi:hypothetical protein
MVKRGKLTEPNSNTAPLSSGPGNLGSQLVEYKEEMYITSDCGHTWRQVRWQKVPGPHPTPDSMGLQGQAPVLPSLPLPGTLIQGPHFPTSLSGQARVPTAKSKEPALRALKCPVILWPQTGVTDLRSTSHIQMCHRDI